MTPEEQEALAKARFAKLNAARGIGVLIMVAGMIIVATGLIQPKDIVGSIIFAVGFLQSIAVPAILARKWRTPPAQ